MNAAALFRNTLLQRWKILDASWRFALAAFLIVRLFYALWSWTILTIQPLAVQNMDFAGEPVLTVFSLWTNQGYTYLRRIDGQDLTFQPVSADAIIDQQTKSIWEVSTGTALRGQYQGIRLLPAKTQPALFFSYLNTTPYSLAWLAIWQRFDANWYTSIAETGYGGIQGDIHFPPLFPLLIRLLKPLFGNAFLAGLVLSHLAALYALKLLYDTFSSWGGILIAKRAVLLMLIYPTSFFLFSAYSESLFLIAALLALQQMRKRSWAWAGFWTFCAILTRLQGIALVIPLMYLLWLDRPFLRKPAQWFGLALPALGGLFYLFLRSMQAQNNVVPLVEADLHARIGAPWTSYGYAIRTLLSGHFAFIDLVNWIVVTLFVIVLISGWRRLPIEYNLYAAFSLLVLIIRIVDLQPLNSMLRYSLTLFPAFLVLSWAADNPWVQRLIVYSFILLNLYLSAQFFSWGWVA